VGSDARTDRWVPRISGPGILGAGCERGRALAGGAHESVTQATGGGKRWGPDRRGHGKARPAGQRRMAGAGADPRTRGDGWGPLVSSIEGGGEKSVRETASGPRMSGSMSSSARNRVPAVGHSQQRRGEGGASAWTLAVGRRPQHDGEAPSSTLIGKLRNNREKNRDRGKEGAPTILTSGGAQARWSSGCRQVSGVDATVTPDEAKTSTGAVQLRRSTRRGHDGARLNVAEAKLGHGRQGEGANGGS
jgi:hypothetical protein